MEYWKSKQLPMAGQGSTAGDDQMKQAVISVIAY
jgi:hypothetical protein